MNIKITVLERLEKIYLAPLVPWALFFCSGMALGPLCRAPVGFLLLLGLFLSLLGALFLKKRLIAHLFIYSLAFLLGALTLQDARARSYGFAAPEKKQTVLVKGVIISDPVTTENTVSFVLEAREIKKDDSSCKLDKRFFCLSRRPFDYAYGDEMELQGSLYGPYGFFKNRAVAAVLNVKKDGFIELLRRRRGNPFKHIALDLRQRMKKIFRSSVGPFSAVILNGILLGETGPGMKPVRDIMVRTGTWHIMVVSGSHTALLAFIFLMFFKMLRLPRVLRFCLTMAMLALYCLLTGSSDPVVRSTVMAILFLTTYMIRRNPLVANSLALAALTILIFDPEALFNVGFQLSFLSVIFIVWFYPKIKPLFPAAGGVVWDCFAVSLSAWVGTAPLLAYAFGNFCLVTVLANMVVVPLAMVVVFAGFALVFFGSFSTFLAHLLAPSVELLIFFLFKANAIFASLPGAFYAFPPISLPAVFCCYVVLFICSFCLKYT